MSRNWLVGSAARPRLTALSSWDEPTLAGSHVPEFGPAAVTRSDDRSRRLRLLRADWFGERLSENSERLYESDNGVLGGPHRSAAGGRSGAPETEMAQRRIAFLSLMYKKSSDPGNSPTASRPSARELRDRSRSESDRPATCAVS